MLNVERIPFSCSTQWQVDENGYLSHLSGKFFRVVGVESFLPLAKKITSQPLIDQPETGMLCFLVTKQANHWWILIQAKVEPGNAMGGQVAPTVQATKSNFTAVHNGKSVPYLSIAQSENGILYTQLQSEQNSRFLEKLNCNKVIIVSKKIALENSSFKWLRLNRLLPFLKQSNAVNSDARSVLACWIFTNPDVLFEKSKNRHSSGHWIFDSLRQQSDENTNSIIKWLVNLRDTYLQKRRIIPLVQLPAEWRWSDNELALNMNSNLKIYQIHVHCTSREVEEWDQPIFGTIDRAQLISTMSFIDGRLCFLLQARMEIGSRSGFELTTTIQAESINGLSVWEKNHLFFLKQEGNCLLEFENSEEGGRFDHCVSQYKLFYVTSEKEVKISPFHRWVSIKEISLLLKKQNFITNELRSTLSSLLSLDEFSP